MVVFFCFLLSDIVVFLLLVKLITYDLILGGCREQCVILATFLNLMANLKVDFQVFFISNCIKVMVK